MDKYRILVIEDDAVIAEQVKNYLEKRGYEVIGIKDFQNVLKEFTEVNPHLVLMDIGLPFFKGIYDTFRRKQSAGAGGC